MIMDRNKSRGSQERCSSQSGRNALVIGSTVPPATPVGSAYRINGQGLNHRQSQEPPPPYITQRLSSLPPPPYLSQRLSSLPPPPLYTTRDQYAASAHESRNATPAEQTDSREAQSAASVPAMNLRTHVGEDSRPVLTGVYVGHETTEYLMQVYREWPINKELPSHLSRRWGSRIVGGRRVESPPYDSRGEQVSLDLYRYQTPSGIASYEWVDSCIFLNFLFAKPGHPSRQDAARFNNIDTLIFNDEVLGRFTDAYDCLDWLKQFPRLRTLVISIDGCHFGPSRRRARLMGFKPISRITYRTRHIATKTRVYLSAVKRRQPAWVVPTLVLAGPDNLEKLPIRLMLKVSDSSGSHSRTVPHHQDERVASNVLGGESSRQSQEQVAALDDPAVGLQINNPAGTDLRLSLNIASEGSEVPVRYAHSNASSLHQTKIEVPPQSDRDSSTTLATPLRDSQLVDPLDQTTRESLEALPVELEAEPIIEEPQLGPHIGTIRELGIMRRMYRNVAGIFRFSRTPSRLPRSQSQPLPRSTSFFSRRNRR